MNEQFKEGMNLISIGGQKLVLHTQSLQTKEALLRDQVGAITICLGERRSDEDLANIHQKLTFREFGLYAEFEVPYAEQAEEGYPAFDVVQKDIQNELLTIGTRPLAVMIVASSDVAERPWFRYMDPSIRELRWYLGAKDTFVYPIILGSSREFYLKGEKDPNGHFSRSSMRAAELDATYLPYNYDSPSVSIRRLVEFMNRIMGCDLPGGEFPDYSFDELRKIAWHISKEDFNAWFPREDAIPKYPIVNGKPQFAF